MPQLLLSACMQFSEDRVRSLVLVKLDLSKAYHHVDWGFLARLVEKTDFQSKWVQWVVTCVSTVHNFVRFNGVPLYPFSRLLVYAKVISYFDYST